MMDDNNSILHTRYYLLLVDQGVQSKKNGELPNVLERHEGKKTGDM